MYSLVVKHFSCFQSLALINFSPMGGKKNRRTGQGLGFGSWEMRRAHTSGPGGSGGRWEGAHTGCAH